MYKKLFTTKFQLASIFIVSIYIATLLIVQYNDNIYGEKRIIPHKVSMQTKKLASNIEVGMHINSFPEFFFNKGDFTIDAIIWFKFPKSTEALSTLEKFTIQNSRILKGAKLIYKSAPIIKLLNEKVLVSYHIQAAFKTYLHYKQFPLGDHRLNIIVQNRSITSREMCFTSKNENLTLSDDIMVDGWTPIKKYAVGGYMKSILHPKDPAMTIDYPCTVFTIDFTSVGARSLFTLYFPLFVVFFIGFLSLIINIFNFSRLGIIASSLPMLVLFRMVIENVSPPVGYATNIDFTFYTLVLLSLIILFLQMYIVLETQKIKKIKDKELKAQRTRRLEKINYTTFFVILILLILFMTYNYMR